MQKTLLPKLLFLNVFIEKNKLRLFSAILSAIDCRFQLERLFFVLRIVENHLASIAGGAHLRSALVLHQILQDSRVHRTHLLPSGTRRTHRPRLLCGTGSHRTWSGKTALTSHLLAFDPVEA